MSGGWTALLLAGQRPGESGFAEAHGVALKALIPAGGEAMIGRVARTLLAAPSVDRIVLLAQQPALLLEALPWMAAEPRIATAPSGQGISTSIAAVAGSQSAPWPLLVTTADHALLTPDMVETFLAGSAGADVAVGLVERTTIEAAYPETRRTWLRFSDGAYSGANLFALRTPAAIRVLDIWASVERDRKKAARLLLHFGPWLALRALTRTISLDSALGKAGRRVGLQVQAVRLAVADAAIDIDTEADLVLAERILKERAAS